MSHVNNGEGVARPENMPQAPVEPIRYHYMDNLRALAMLLGIFFHAALAYSPMMQNLWLAADPVNSIVMDSLAWFSHTFRMPLFFIIAGFFALMLIEKRGIGGFIKHRLLRIGVPFIVFLPLCLTAVIMTIGWATNDVENPSPMLQMIKMMQNNPEAPQPPFSTMHLWFLFNLMLFCVVIAGVAKTRLLESSLVKSLCNAKVLLFVFPLILVPAVMSQPTPLPAPERIYPEVWSFGFFGVFFLLGAALFANRDAIEGVQKYALFLLPASIAVYAGYYQLVPQSVSLEQLMAGSPVFEFSTQQLGKALMTAYLATWMSLFCLVAGKALLDRQNTVMRYISRSSYWVYIIHLPVLFLIQFMLLDMNAHFFVKYLIGSFGTLAIGIVSYQLLVAWTPIGTLLNGKKAN